MAGVVFILRKFFEQALSRDIENYKARLEQELEHSKLNFQSELQTKFFEFQTKFSIYHQQRAEFIRDLYAHLAELEQRISHMIPTIYGDEYMLDDMRSPDRRKEEEEVYQFYQEVNKFYSKNCIYLDEETAYKVKSVLDAMLLTIIKFGQALSGVEKLPEETTRIDEATLKLWEGASKDMWDKISPLKRQLEREFRKSLSVVTKDDA